MLPTRRTSPKNAAVAVFKIDPRGLMIFMVRDRKYRKWMIPGGRVDSGDRGFFDAARREFREETGVSLPRLYRMDGFLGGLPSFLYNWHTWIYWGQVKGDFSFNRKSRRNREVDRREWFYLDDLLKGDAKYEGKKIVVKGYVWKSLKDLKTLL